MAMTPRSLCEFALPDDPSLDALPLALISLLERRHLDAADADHWRFWLETEADAQQHPLLQRIATLPRDELPPNVLAQALSASAGDGHATVIAIDAAPDAVELHVGLRRSPGRAAQSLQDALAAQAGAFGNISGLTLAPAQPMSGKHLPRLCGFINQAPCLMTVTGSAKPRALGSLASLERLIHAAGGGRFAMTLVAQAQPPEVIDGMLDVVRKLRSEVHVYTRRSLSFSTSESQSVSVNNPDRGRIELDRLPMILLALSSAAQLGAGLGAPMALSMVAQPLAALATLSQQRSIGHLRMTGEQHGSSQSTTTGGQLDLLDANAQACEQILLRHEERLAVGRAQGWWRTAVYLAADDEPTIRRLAGALQAMAIGDGPASEPVRVIRPPRGIVRDAMRTGGFVRIAPRTVNPALDPMAGALAQDSLTTLLTTEELALMAALPSGEIAGMARRGHASFAMVSASTAATGAMLGHLLDDRGSPIAPIGLDSSALNRNVLVTGIVGSGKSTTCKRLLTEARAKFRVPFLVIEPVKTEYRQLVGDISDLEVFSVGDGFGLPLRLNPLEPVPGFPLARHIDLLKAVFNAAFPMGGGMSQVLEEALIAAYTERGWSVRRGLDPRERLGAQELEGAALMPNLSDLLVGIDTAIRRKGYAGEVSSNINAALRSRVEGLLKNQKGVLLDTRRSTPHRRLFGRSAVLELQSLGDDDEKAFVMAILLVLLGEWAEMRQAELPPASHGQLQHLTLVEEAHRLLSAARPASPDQADARGKAVGMFTDLLAELRAYGEGFIIADQIPTKLAPETLKNTAVKIAHRLAAADDRNAMAGCADLNEAQARHLNRLPPGQAVLHDPNIGEAVLLAVEPLPPPASVPAHPARTPNRDYLRHSAGCDPCRDPCRWRDEVLEDGLDTQLAPYASLLVDALLEGSAVPAPPAAPIGQSGLRACALLAAVRHDVTARALTRIHHVGLAGLRPVDTLSVERAMTAMGPAVFALAESGREEGQASAEGLLREIAASPPLERPGCQRCAVRCRVLPLAGALRARADRLAALAVANQDPALRVHSYIEASRPLAIDSNVLWCLAVQQVGNRHAEPGTQVFLELLRQAI